MSDIKKQIFKYRGTDLLAGGKLVDEQVANWYKEHEQFKVTKITDERILDVQSETELECIINLVFEYTERKNDGEE